MKDTDKASFTTERTVLAGREVAVKVATPEAAKAVAAKAIKKYAQALENLKNR